LYYGRAYVTIITVPIIFPVTFQTVINLRMLSTGDRLHFMFVFVQTILDSHNMSRLRTVQNATSTTK